MAIDPARRSGSVETPPTPTGELRRWAEEIVDYLIRMNTDKQRQIDDLAARVEALENP